MKAEECNGSFEKSSANLVINTQARKLSSTGLDASLNTVSLWKRDSIDLNRSPPKSPSPPLEGIDTGEVSSTYKANPSSTNDPENASSAAEKVKRRRAQVNKAVRKYNKKFTAEGQKKAKETMNSTEYEKYINLYKKIKKRNMNRDRSYVERQKRLREQGDPAAIATHAKKLTNFLAWYHKGGKQKIAARSAEKRKDDQGKPPLFSKRALQGESFTAEQDARPKDREQIQKMIQLKKRKAVCQKLHRSSMSKKAEKEAEKVLPPEEFKELQGKIKDFRTKRLIASKENYQRRKAKRLAGDEVAIQAYALKLQRKRDRQAKLSVGKFLADGRSQSKKSKTETSQETSKVRSYGAAEDFVDTELRLFRRGEGETLHSPPETSFYFEREPSLLKRTDINLNIPLEASPAVESVPSSSAVSAEIQPKKRRKRHYEQFTKKAEEEARNKFSKEEFENYQKRLQDYRQKRSGYGMARSARIRIARQTGDKKSTEVYTKRLERKKKRYHQGALGAFLATDSLPQHDHQNAKLSDADLHTLLKQPLDHSSKKYVERKLFDRQKKRVTYTENMKLYRSGDPKGKEWYEKKKEASRIAMAKYNAVRKQSKQSGSSAAKTD
ncbi:uncharacterized protein FA14DRAFT_177076 [Meira miltonrushii]|uniref:Uncharacterized protein n=1 Tax=Meira miltonrushii TaxID=1280837 RepID=A0A316VKL9_9BASI|nr:uncharacterized protein FA14DRAFT_177076 [Meira miltonrushii]PWN37794.1 hypothetical protein FA14DRAFT_177076 [Meira miltonrushii]